MESFVINKNWIASLKLFINGSDVTSRDFGSEIIDNALDAGATEFKYYGPDDETTREFCERHVGKTYTKEEIAEIWSGEWAGKISGDPFVVRGGYNCRHRFRGIFEQRTLCMSKFYDRALKLTRMNPLPDNIADQISAYSDMASEDEQGDFALLLAGIGVEQPEAAEVVDYAPEPVEPKKNKKAAKK